LADCYRALASNPDDKGRALGFALAGGSLHVKAGLLPGSREAFAAKVNVNLPGNPERHGLPTIQGVVMLVDTLHGRPLALMESMTLTALRTAATAALAARHGARLGSRRLAVIGCGAQAPYQVAALRQLFPLQEIRFNDLDRRRAELLAQEAAATGLASIVTESAATAVEGADICVTCTTSKTAVLTDALPLRGAFVAAMGADNPEKHEVDPLLLARARILVDDAEACAGGGDLGHALRAGVLRREAVHADLAELAAGTKRGRLSDDELVIFDSTGSGVQDVAAAWAAYNAAQERGVGLRFDLSGDARAL
jgi:ornithine cyclodeaminase/alanine dehydrogenase-like protein (mu-crystallin family)